MDSSKYKIRILMVLGVLVGMVASEGNAFPPPPGWQAYGGHPPGWQAYGGYPPGYGGHPVGAPSWAAPRVPYGYYGGPRFSGMNAPRGYRPSGFSFSFTFCGGHRHHGNRGYGPPPGYPLY